MMFGLFLIGVKMEESIQDTEEVLIHDVLLGSFKITTKLLEDLEKYSQDYSLPLVVKNFNREGGSSPDLKEIINIDIESIIGYIKITDRKYSVIDGGRVIVYGELKLTPKYESLYEETILTLNGFSSPIHLVRLVKAYMVTKDNHKKRLEEGHEQLLYARLAEPDTSIKSMEEVLEIAKRNDLFDEV